MANQGKPIPAFGKGEQVQPMVGSFLEKLAAAGQKDNGIIKDSDDKGQVRSQLSPSEIERYKKIFGVFKEVVHPGPEVGQLDKKFNNKTAARMSKTTIGSAIVNTSASNGDVSTWMKALGAAIFLLPWKDLFMGIWRSIKGAFAVGDLVKSLKLDKVFKAAKLKIFQIFGGFMDTIKDMLKFGKAKVVKMFDSALDVLKGSKIVKGINNGLQALNDFAKGLKNSKWAKGAIGMMDSMKALFTTFQKGKLVSSATNMIKSFTNIMSGFADIFKTVARPFKTVGTALFKGAGFITKLVAGAGAKFLRFGKFIPFIGSIFNFMTAVQAFNNGETGRGILEIISGVLNMVPGVGNVASGLLDGGLLLYDLFSENKTGEGVRELTGDMGGKLKDIFGPIGDAVMGVFGWLGDAISNVFGFFKDIVGGIFQKGFSMIKGAVASIPGIGDWVADKLEGAAEWVGDAFTGGDSSPSMSDDNITEVQKTIDMSTTIQTEMLQLKKTEMKMYDFMCKKLDALEKSNAAMLQQMRESSPSNTDTMKLETSVGPLDVDFYRSTVTT